MTKLSTGPFAELLATPLKTEVVGRRIVTFDEIDSTNTYALEHGDEGMVIVADRQTAGRGRQGRTWHSAPGLGLWFTVVLEEALEGLTFAAALSVRDALAERCSLQIKWPNDLLLNGKKVCGILVERRHGRTAVGIGLNVHHRIEDFPDDLREKAGSLASETNGEWDRVVILREVLTNLDRKVILLRAGGYESIRREWAESCRLVGRRIQSGRLAGTVLEIDGRGGIVLETAEGLHRLISGEITPLDGE